MSTTTTGRLSVPTFPLDGLRRHKLLTVDIARRLPAIRSTDGQGLDAIVQAKLFTPFASTTWFVTEGSPNAEGGWDLYGVEVNGAEERAGWTYLDLMDLASATVRTGTPAVERDCWFHAGRTVEETVLDTRETGGIPAAVLGFVERNR